MRVHVDLTNAPHVTVFAPFVRELQARGDDVLVTARRFGQTLELCEQHGLDVEVVGSHGGASRAGKARAAVVRTRELTGLLRRATRRDGRFDVAISHGSTDAPAAARRLGVPHVTMFDYEWASTMHRLNCRLSWRVLVPDAIPPARLWSYHAAGKVSRYPGLKESYCLDADRLRPADARAALGLDTTTPLVVLRPPPSLALYHRGRETGPFDRALEQLLAQDGIVVVALPRTDVQRQELVAHADLDHAATLLVPDTAQDGPSLVAGAHLVLSAGGTMNREAAALGVPVATALQARPAAIDEALESDGLMRRIEDVDIAGIDWSDVAGSLGLSADAAARWRLRPMSELVDRAFDGLPQRM